jgi:N-acetyl-gamma-glutamylphosphate reductase
MNDKLMSKRHRFAVIATLYGGWGRETDRKNLKISKQPDLAPFSIYEHRHKPGSE